MTARYLSLLFVLFAAVAFTAQQPAPTPELQPELKQALAHDDACFKPGSPAASDQALAGSVAADPISTGQSVTEQVVTEPIRVGGREAGIIAAPQDACGCANGNCSTFVYLKSGDSYKLALQDRFSSLKPMKIVKHGMPSLSGKFQVSAGQEETTVFDWSGRQYQPSLCATVTQRKNVRLPSISRHPCKEAGRRD
ncbi:MAG TPA: hypothetical protein VN669_07885 [Candidatus Acidoferrales bacterium]|nr:hypothetical protein [Candidatus Acidoferrales bacterium]